MSRHYEQSMGYWLNEPAILNPSLVREAMRDLAARGYGIVRIMCRNTNYSHGSPEVVHAVAAGVETAHDAGIRAVLDAEPHRLIAREMGRRYPDAIATRLHKAEGRLVDGLFRIHVEGLHSLAEMSIYEGIEAAYLERDGVFTRLEMPDVQVVWETETRGGDYTVVDQPFAPGLTVGPRRHLQLSGRLPEVREGRLIFYVRLRDNGLIDFAAPGCKAFFRELLDLYGDVSLDGVCWDEPAVGGSWTNYRYGQAFADRFADAIGGDPRERLYLLDETGLSADAVRFRLTYYELLNETLFEAQSDMIAHARTLFGEDLLLGTHHTWSGEGGINDTRAGAVDYFRLTDPMDAGYTDCSWWDRDSVAYCYVLGSSLGRLTPSGECECNSWTWNPTIAQVEDNVRLMSLMNITWFHLWYGENADTCMIQWQPCWETSVQCMREHQALQRALGTARPVVEVAVLHDWQSICGVNDAGVANLHKAFCINFARSRAGSEPAVRLHRFPPAWRRGGRGRRVRLRPGPLPDSGHPLRDRAERRELADAPDVPGGRGQTDLRGTGPGDDGRRPADRRELRRMVRDARTGVGPLPSLVRQRQCRFAPVATVALRPGLSRHRARRTTAFLPGTRAVWHCRRHRPDRLLLRFEPSDAVLEQLLEWVSPAARLHSDSAWFRHYRREDEDLVVIVAREGRSLSGIFEHGNQAYRLEGGRTACLRIAEGQSTVLAGDGKVGRL